MKFSSTDKRSETVSLIRNKKIYFIGRNKCIIKKIECWPVFKQDPKSSTFLCHTSNDEIQYFDIGRTFIVTLILYILFLYENIIFLSFVSIAMI